MGCHTWLYKHIPERQEEYKKCIIEQGKHWANHMIDMYKNPDNNEDNHTWYVEFIDDCKKFIEDWKDASQEDIEKYFDNLESLNSEIEFCDKAKDWTFDQYIDWLISEEQKQLDVYNSGNIPMHGSFKHSDRKSEYSDELLYTVVGEKIYVYGIIPHGDDIGRIHDYEQPNCFTAEETIECFKNHNVEYDEAIIRELFKQNDMFVHFG